MLSGIDSINSQILQTEINQGYDRFLSIVSEGRHMTKTEVDKIAQGQVWLGRDALKYNLVDELGDFDTAVAKIKSLIVTNDDKISEKDLGVEWLQEDDDSPLETFLKGLNKQTQIKIKTKVMQELGIPKTYSQIVDKLNILDKLNDPKGQYLYCLGCGNVQ